MFRGLRSAVLWLVVRIWLLRICACDAHTSIDDYVLFYRCEGGAVAYAASWIAHVNTVPCFPLLTHPMHHRLCVAGQVLETPFVDKLGMEFHDFFMFYHLPGHPRICMKTQTPK